MIKSFKSRRLRQLYETGASKRILADMRDKIRKILFFLNQAKDPRDMNLPQWRLHRLKGDRKEQWAIWVSGNYRIIFRMVAGQVEDVEFVDYH